MWREMINVQRGAHGGDLSENLNLRTQAKDLGMCSASNGGVWGMGNVFEREILLMRGADEGDAHEQGSYVIALRKVKAFQNASKRALNSFAFS